ncbi:MAG: phosphonate ABC transporter ATP-binding protein [Acidimicrobiia bacterium]
MIILENVHKRFGRTTALDGVSFEVEAGAFVAVLGPSGAGKTTLLRCLTGMIRPDSGRILVGGADLAALEGRELREVQRRIGMVHQQFNLVGRLRVLTNVLAGRLAGQPARRWLRYRFTAEERRLAYACLARVDLADRAYQRSDTLSGGQQQRVALARAMCQQPRLLLADEPVASVDPGLAERILGYLGAMNRADGVTTIVNLHTVSLARRFADRVIGVNAGNVVVDAPAALLDDVAVLRRIYAGNVDEEELEIALAAAHPAVVPA